MSLTSTAHCHGFQAAAPPQTFAEVRNRCPGTWCCQALVLTGGGKCWYQTPYIGGVTTKITKLGSPAAGTEPGFGDEAPDRANKPAYIIIKTWFYLRHYRTPKFLLKVPLMQAWIKHDKRLFARKVWRLLKCRQVCICARVCANVWYTVHAHHWSSTFTNSVCVHVHACACP